MQASECCIIRASMAAVIGGFIAIALLLKHGALIAVMVSPFAGSATAVAAVALFWFVSLFIPCEPKALLDGEIVQ